MKIPSKTEFGLLCTFFIGLINIQIIAQDEILSPVTRGHLEHLEKKNTTLFYPEIIPLGPVLNSARVEAVQGHPSFPNVIYTAFGSGNLWKSNNGGLTWDAIFEHEAALGIGDLVIAPSDPDILYLGSGESLRKRRNFTLPGNGIYRSGDGGKTWTNRGLEESWHTGEIVVHPHDPDIVFVASMGSFWSPGNAHGIYRTYDGGENWDKVLYVDDLTRANDIVIAPSEPNVVYASFWENNPDTVLFESVWGPNSGIYVSSDLGETWEKRNSGLPEGPNIGRIGIAVSHSDPDKAYALIDNHNNDRPQASEIYKTTDRGKSWKKTHEDPLYFSSVIGWYFADIYVNPHDDEEIYGLGVRLIRSSDGGKNFEYVGGQVHHLHPSAAQTLHLDHCELWIDPEDPDHLLLGNDGGLYESRDRGENWLHFNNIPTGEFYTITIEETIPYRIFGGTQDDATVVGQAEELDLRFPDPWKYLWIDAWSGGDGCITQVDPNDQNTVYFSMQNGAIRRKDMAADTSVGIRPKLPSNDSVEISYNFVTPYLLSYHNSNCIYQAGSYLMKSCDRGESWNRISPDLSTSANSEKISLAAGALAESRLQQGLLFAGTDKGAFWVTTDDGNSWSERSEGLANAYIRSIYPSRHEESRVYLAMTGLNYDDLEPHLYVSEDLGVHWNEISSDLPESPVNVIIEDPHNPELLYAGTLRGLYLSYDRGLHWSFIGNNMPTTPIADLVVHPLTQDLIIATHGRGLYLLNTIPIHNALRFALGDTSEQIALFEIPPVTSPKKRDTHREIDQQSIRKAVISFWSDTEQPVTLSLRLKEDGIDWKQHLNAKKGLNQFRWDLVHRQNESAMPYYIHYKNYLKAGTYKLQLSSNTQTVETILTVE